MPISPDNLKRRNDHILCRFRFHRKKNPKWNIIFIIDEVAKEIFLEPTTVAKVLKKHQEEVPCVDTISKQIKELQAVA